MIRALVAVLVALLLLVAPAAAQDPTTTTIPEVPAQDIVPQPDSGERPTEAGDRGGGLQLAVLALVAVGIGVVVLRVVLQARRASGAG
jgi:hypothetical protein